MIPPVAIVVAVLGGIYTGIATPTESGGVGAFVDGHLRCADRVFELVYYEKGCLDDIGINLDAHVVDHRGDLLHQCLHCPWRSTTDSEVCRFAPRSVVMASS